jgi:hypothetical protein
VIRIPAWGSTKSRREHFQGYPLKRSP